MAKPNNSKLAKAAGEPPQGTPNPWASETWNLTRQMTFYKEWGEDIAREWAAAAGTTLGGPKPKPKVQKGEPGPQGARGARGASGDGDGSEGPQGNPGWSPVLALITDGERRVIQILDWTGGDGEKPITGDYLGSSGHVGDIADATDLRGPSGSTGPTGPAGEDGQGGQGEDGDDIYDIPFFYRDQLPSDGSAVVFEHVTPRVYRLADDFEPSVASLQVAVHTENLSFPIYMNDQLIGSIDFVVGVGVQDDGSQRGAFVPLSPPADSLMFQRWDRLRVLAASVQDDAASGLAVTFAGVIGDTFNRITEFGERRITETGEVRILELP